MDEHVRRGGGIRPGTEALNREKKCIHALDTPSHPKDGKRPGESNGPLGKMKQPLEGSPGKKIERVKETQIQGTGSLNFTRAAERKR